MEIIANHSFANATCFMWLICLKQYLHLRKGDCHQGDYSYKSIIRYLCNCHYSIFITHVKPSSVFPVSAAKTACMPNTVKTRTAITNKNSSPGSRYRSSLSRKSVPYCSFSYRYRYPAASRLRTVSGYSSGSFRYSTHISSSQPSSIALPLPLYGTALAGPIL